LNGLFTTRSADWILVEGEGLVGEAYAKQAVIFAKDLQSARKEDIISSVQLGSTMFLRHDLAKEYGIHSALFLPTPAGVYEVGSVQLVESRAGLFHESFRTAFAGAKDATQMLACLWASANSV